MVHHKPCLVIELDNGQLILLPPKEDGDTMTDDVVETESETETEPDTGKAAKAKAKASA